MKYLCESNTHVPAVGKMSIPGLLFADDLAIGLVTVTGLQKRLTISQNIAKIGVQNVIEKRPKY
jgi:hypothetical protein